MSALVQPDYSRLANLFVMALGHASWSADSHRTTVKIIMAQPSPLSALIEGQSHGGHAQAESVLSANDWDRGSRWPS
jgi:hypothetical protein